MNWDLGKLYAGFDDPALARDAEEARKQIDSAASAVAALTIPADAKALSHIVSDLQSITTLLTKVASFTFLTLAVDANNEGALAFHDKVMHLDMASSSSALSRYLGSVDDLESLIQADPLLAEHAFMLREMKNRAAHTIDPALEPTVLKMQMTGGKAWEQLRDQLDSNLMIPFEKDGKVESLPLSAIRGLAYSADADVRKRAYEAEIAAYPRIEIPMAACLNGIKGEALTLAGLKHFDSVLDTALDVSRMDRATLDALISALKDSLPMFRRYFRAKAKLLGYEGGLKFYDLFAPVGESHLTYTLDEARATLIQVMGKFSKKRADFIDRAFEERWIDAYPREGKTGGAFCSPVHFADRSLVMTNFTGSFSDVSTIAHELGHAWHNRCLAGLPYSLIDTPMPLAETASIFNEQLLAHMVLKDASPDEQLSLLEGNLMETNQTIVDIYSRYLFETEVIDTRADHAMSVDELKDAMLRAQEASYGDGLDPEIRHPYMWACKSHYYSSGYNFYNFPYAFGELFAKGVFAQYLQKGAAFVPDYCRLLRSCGSGTIADVAASVGIDVRNPDFWRSSLEVVKGNIDKFCELVK
ncbi:MAG: M3 family oligoendopeptidase [Christensenellales bacterium]